MILNLVAEKIVFNALKSIKYGRINLTNFNGSKFVFGKEDDRLVASIKIKNPGLMGTIINKGSIGLAEAYIRNDFETDNLSNLIEITAKNIKTVHKFSGIFDFKIINFIKNVFIKKYKKKEQRKYF